MPVVARAVFWICAVIVVGTEVLRQWAMDNFLIAILAVPMFPITFFVSPWFNGTQIVFLVGMAAYVMSTAGGMRSVD